jgi:hypothetical protein
MTNQGNPKCGTGHYISLLLQCIVFGSHLHFSTPGDSAVFVPFFCPQKIAYTSVYLSPQRLI